MTPYESVRKAAKKAKRQQQAPSTLLRKATAEVPRIGRIVALEKQLGKKKLTDAERNNIGASLLREKLAASQELSEAQAAERAAQMSAMAATMSRPHDPRAQTHAPYPTGDYLREAPDRSRTECAARS